MTTRNIKALLPTAIVAATLPGTFVTPAQAGDDPSIKAELRTHIHKAMDAFVSQQTTDGSLRLYDPVAGELLRLASYELHSGIVKKGDFYVSCADFVDQEGRKIDVDFLVIPSDGELRATQGIVHSVAGEKRKFHLE